MVHEVAASLLLLSLAQASVFPPPVNLTSRRISYEPLCEEAKCVLEFIREKEETNCSHLESPQTRKILQLHSSKQIRTEYVFARFARSEIRYCPDMCTVGSMFSYIRAHLGVQLESALAFTNDLVAKEICGWPVDFCSWWGRSVRVRTRLPLLAFPTTFILNWVNLATLRKLILAQENPAAAMYLHRVEVYSDLVLCSFLYFEDIFVYSSFAQFMSRACFPNLYTYAYIYEFFLSFMSFLTFVNQCAVLNLVSDRLDTLRDPFAYQATLGESNDRKLTLLTLLVSGLLYLPFILVRTFEPLLEYWFGKTSLYTITGVIYSVPPVLCVGLQIYKARKYERAYSEFQKRKAQRLGITEVELKQLKENEKEKRALLGGTLGVNLVTSCVNFMVAAVYNPAYNYSHANSKELWWWLPLLGIFEPFLNFVNGSSSFIVHIILLKQYRWAFLETRAGKVIGRLIRAGSD